MRLISLALAGVLWAAPSWADTEVFVGSLSTGTAAAGNTVAVTGVGFTPKAIIFFWGGTFNSTADNVTEGNVNRGIGFTAGASDNFSIASRSGTAGGTAVADKRLSDDACISQVGDGSSLGRADLQSFDMDGFTLEILTAFTADFRVSFIAVGGDELANADTGSFSPPVGVEVQNITGLSFQPDFVMVLGYPQFNATNTTNSNFSIGMATGTSNQWVFMQGSADGADPTVTNRYGVSSEIVALVGTPNDTVIARAEFNGFTSDGFSLDWVENLGTAFLVRYLALDFGGSVKVGNLLTQTDTMTTVGTGSLGFVPKGAFLASHNAAEDTADTPVAHDQLSMGAATSATTRVAHANRDEDNVTTSDAVYALQSDGVYVHLDDTSVIGKMDVSTWGTDAVDFVMDNADDTQAFVGYVIFGEAADAPATGTSPNLLLLGVGE